LKLKKLLKASLALVLALCMSVSALAATHSVSNSDEMVEAFKDTDTEVIINMTADITMLDELQAMEGQSYIINGYEFTIKDVGISGPGSVTINSDVSTENAGGALYADNGANVTVNGNVTSEDGAGVASANNSSLTVNGDINSYYSGATAVDDSSITVDGSVTAETDLGASAANGSSISVTGDVTSNDEYGAGISSYEDSSVTVGGDVNAAGTGVSAEYNSSVSVEGDVTSSHDTGVSAGSESTVTVGGSVTGGSGDPDSVDYTDPTDYSDGSNGINVYDNSTVEVAGDVTGGDGYGTYAYGGTGAIVESGSSLTVGGNITGGNVTADPETEAEKYSNSLGGDGLFVSSDSTVNVGGNVTGGNTNANSGIGGYGVVLSVEVKEAPSGSVNIDGQAIGGTGGDGAQNNGAALYLSYYNDSTDLLTTPMLSSIEDLYDFYSMLNYIDSVEEELTNNGDMNAEQIDTAMADLWLDLSSVCETYGFDSVATADDIYEASLTMEADELKDFANALYDALCQWASDVLVESATPELTVSSISGGVGIYDDGDFSEDMLNNLNVLLSSFSATIKYNVNITDSENGAVTSDKQSAVVGETVTLKVTPDTGYELESITLNGKALEAKNGVYSFEMTEAGAQIEAKFVKLAASGDSDSGSDSTAPKTSDESQPGLYIFLAVMSAAGAVLTFKKRVLSK
jgi:hypothetical protein